MIKLKKEELELLVIECMLEESRFNGRLSSGKKVKYTGKSLLDRYKELKGI